MVIWLALLFTHAVLLVLAATSFTVVTGLSDGQYNWEYYRYVSQRGWGTPYQFHYTLPVVVTYLAAYATGIGAYGVAWRNGLPVIGFVGVVLCGVGFVSFAYELTHWFSDHYGSWIASAPVALLILAIVAVALQYRRHVARPATA